MRTKTNRQADAGAFTLMELMVVLVMIAILSALILPEMRGTLDDAILRSSARKLIDVMGLAGSRAVALGQAQRIHVDRASGRYALESQAGRSSRGAPFVAVRDVSGAAGQLDSRIAVEFRRSETRESGTPSAPGGQPGLDVIAFYPDGTADATEVTLRDRAGFALVLRLNPVTARVQILKRPRS